MNDDVEIRHEPERQRFVAQIGGSAAEAVLDYRRLSTSVLEYYRTFTPEAYRGEGVARRLVSHALEHARATGQRVVPTCPFVAKIMGSDAKYAPLLAERPG